MTSSIKNTQALLSEQLGQLGGVEIFTTAAQTSKDYYAIYFVQESVIAAITMTNSTGSSNLLTTVPAGMTLFGQTTAITLTSGLAIFDFICATLELVRILKLTPLIIHSS